MLDQPQRWILVVTFSVLTGPLFGPGPMPKPTATNPRQQPVPSAAFDSFAGVWQAHPNTTHDHPAEQTGPLFSDGVRAIGTFTVERPGEEDLPLPHPAPPSSSRLPSSMRVMFPNRESLVIHVLCVVIYTAIDVLAAAVFAFISCGIMAMKITAALIRRLKNQVFTKMMTARPPRRLDRPKLDVRAEPSQPRDTEQGINSVVHEVVKPRPEVAPATVSLQSPRMMLGLLPIPLGLLPIPLGLLPIHSSSKPPEKDKQGGILLKVPPGNARPSDLGDTKEILVFKVKNGVMGRIIGKGGSRLKFMKKDLDLVIKYDKLDDRHCFFHLEGPFAGIETAKALCYKQVQTGLEEIPPADVAELLPPEDVTVKYFYAPEQHGRVVGKGARCLKEMRARGVKVVSNSEEGLKYIALKGTPTSVRQAQLWISDNMNGALFVTTPDLVEAPDPQPTPKPGADGAFAAEPGQGPDPRV